MNPDEFPFASRTDWPHATNAFTRTMGDLRAAGHVLLDLTASNPTTCGIDISLDRTNIPLASEKNLVYRPEAKGLLEARQAVVRYYASNGFVVDPEHLFLTASTSEAYTYLFRLLLNPGESVLLPQPSYPLFQFLAEVNDCYADYYPLTYGDGHWQLDVQSLTAAIQPTTRAIVVVNPNNPTGHYLTFTEIRRLCEIAAERKLAIICDEVFWDFAFEEDSQRASFLGQAPTLVFVLNGLSKILGLPQMKCSWLSVHGPAGLVQRAIERLEIIADIYLSVNTPVQIALQEWLGEREIWQRPILERVRGNWERLCSDGALKDLVLKGEGGWYAVLELPESIRAEQWVLDLMREQQVIVHPGYLFDFEEDHFVVLSLLTDLQDFEEGLRRIGAHLHPGAG